MALHTSAMPSYIRTIRILCWCACAWRCTLARCLCRSRRTVVRMARMQVHLVRMRCFITDAQGGSYVNFLTAPLAQCGLGAFPNSLTWSYCPVGPVRRASCIMCQGSLYKMHSRSRIVHIAFRDTLLTTRTWKTDAREEMLPKIVAAPRAQFGLGAVVHPPRLSARVPRAMYDWMWHWTADGHTDRAYFLAGCLWLPCRVGDRVSKPLD